ncbi:SLH domain protein [Peptostreptococcaceae bacterium AS15]|nr:SLH domain protein [Peptostreptococcaceae bacterium AS15]
MTKSKNFSKKFSLLTIFIILMSIITSQVYAAKLPFTDVPEKSWYYEDVKSAYESDLISGKKPTKYAPNDNMTAAEAVKLAAAMYMLKNEGKVNFAPSKPWYNVYVDYAKRKGLISGDLTWNKNITRAGYMQIFANILTDEEAKKNEVADGSIPDVPMTHPSAQAIYKLYRAGIVTGIDDKKNCSPASNIKRSEVAAILIRMMDVKRRLGFSLSGGTTPPGTTPPPSTTNPLKITKQPTSVKGAVGVTFILDVKVEGGKTPYNYQWEERKVGDRNYTNSSVIGSDTNVLSPTVKNDAYDYRCVITDANGDKVTSADARVEKEVVTSPLKITKHPMSTKGAFGNMVILEVQAEGGTPPYSYQWEFSNLIPPVVTYMKIGDNKNVLATVIPNIPPYYHCIVTDSKGNSVTSNTAKLEIDPSTVSLIISKQPQDVIADAGSSVTLEVGVKGGKPPYRYEWESKHEGEANFRQSLAPGNDTNILRPIVVLNRVVYYRCIVSDDKGNKVTSNTVTVRTDPSIKPFEITKHPNNVIGTPPDTTTLEVKVEGGKVPYSYQWERRGYDDLFFTNSTAEGNTSNVMRVPIEGVNTYRCVITDANGNILTSEMANVSDITSPDFLKIAYQPTFVTGNLGEKVILEVKVEGGRKPYRYKWQYADSIDPVFRDTFEDGYTTNILRPRVTNDQVYYSCTITDAKGDRRATYDIKVTKN